MKEKTNTTKTVIITIAVSIAIALAVGGISALLTQNSMRRFETLKQPALSPPTVLFPIVWSILFVLMGIGAGMVYLSNGKERTAALNLYLIQLAVNFLWTIIFFNLELRLLAFFWLLLLILLVALMIVAFYRVNKTAAYLQIPYFLWLLFAAYLNISVYLLNI